MREPAGERREHAAAVDGGVFYTEREVGLRWTADGIAAALRLGCGGVLVLPAGLLHAAAWDSGLAQCARRPGWPTATQRSRSRGAPQPRHRAACTTAAGAARCVRGRSRRWAVERTARWQNRFRRDQQQRFVIVAAQRLNAMPAGTPFGVHHLPAHAGAIFDRVAANPALLRLTPRQQLERPEPNAFETETFRVRQAALVRAQRALRRSSGAGDRPSGIDGSVRTRQPGRPCWGAPRARRTGIVRRVRRRAACCLMTT